jgi:hypothetical protein
LVQSLFFAQRPACSFFLIWSNLKNMLGLSCAGGHQLVVGIMLPCLYDEGFFEAQPSPLVADWCGLLTFFLLLYSRLPSPVILMFFLLLGWFI